MTQRRTCLTTSFVSSILFVCCFVLGKMGVLRIVEILGTLRIIRSYKNVKSKIKDIGNELTG